MLDVIVWVTIVASFAVTYHLLEKQGYTRGAWTPFFCVLLLVPAWFEKTVVGAGIEPRTACCLAILLVSLMRPMEPGASYRWIFLDTCVVLILLSQLVAELTNYDLRPMMIPDMIRTLVLPYFIGRVLLRSPFDAYDLARTLCLPVVLLSVYAFAESVSHQNPVFDFFPTYTSDLGTSVMFRYGLKRALGMTSHPIYLSLMLSMMLPFLLEIFHRWRLTSTPRWGWAPLWLCLLGIFCTVSRSGQIAAAIILAADLFFRFPRVRPALLVLLVMGGVTFYFGREDLISALEMASGTEAESITIVIKGEAVQYNGTRHRDLLHLVYREDVREGGWLGWGFHFLLKIPLDHHIPSQFKSIDDHYLLVQLRYGRLGVTVFLLFAAVGALCLLRVALDPYHPARTLAGSLFGAFAAVTLLLRGVSMEGDISFPWLFIAGLGGRFYSMRLDALAIREAEAGVRGGGRSWEAGEVVAVRLETPNPPLRTF
jgi:hypothetical protein